MDYTNLINEFLASLDEREMIAYNIAKSHLGTLFSLEKSNAYFEWCFMRACETGDLDFAKDMLRLHPGVNIFDGFMIACKNNKLHIAHWLFETHPNEKKKFQKVIKLLENDNIYVAHLFN